MSLITLRLRGPAGVTTVQLAPEATLFELQASVFSLTSIPPETQEIRSGHPPRLLDTSSGHGASISSLGLRNGDVLVVQEGKAGSNERSTIGETRSPPPPPPRLPLSSATPPLAPQASSSRPQSSSVAKPQAPTSGTGGRSGQPSVPLRSDSEVSNGKITTAAANIKMPLAAPVTSPKAPLGSGPISQPARNARPQQPFAPPVGTTAPSGAKPGLTSTEEAHVKVDGGWMALRVVPDDNSCMFTALAIVLEHDKSGAASDLRQAVAEAIKADPFEWSESVLGMRPETYCQKIIKKETWGGAIELAILSKKYQTEIVSMDVQSGRADRFGEENHYEKQVLLVYSGIHYDALTFTPLEPDPSDIYPYNLEFDQTIFSRTNEGFALAAASELSRKLRDRHYYTDVAGFALRCEVCKKALKGEKEAQAHAKETGHANFGEF